MENQKPNTPMKAIRAFCVSCMGDNVRDVARCTAPNCPLFEFRNGHNPYRKSKEYTEEQLDALRERMKEARKSKDNK